eukprot:TRINITY_DN63615_c0_g1_i1.p1 TRINITY_DN63615_c0_g1~~TRINITY_DN63615_c0_g1_i1.p1  ORF type:complete len:419 (-),score=57.00 TRINITY_DN63615_c0_g1_i1:172-1428(-)
MFFLSMSYLMRAVVASAGVAAGAAFAVQNLEEAYHVTHLELRQKDKSKLMGASKSDLMVNSRVGVSPIPENTTSVPACHDKDVVDFWRNHDIRAASAIDSWRSIVHDGSIMKEKIVASELVSCVASGPLETPVESNHGPHVLSLVSAADVPLCVPGSPSESTRSEFDFALHPDSRMAKLTPSRRVAMLWPLSDTCSEATPCPLMLYFHGCAIEQFFLRFKQECLPDLRTIMVGPTLARSEDGSIEKWTEPENDMLDSFVMPLLASLRANYGGLIDWNRVVVVGTSMGSGMALQAGLRYPDVFAGSFAIGLTDGHICSFDSFDKDIFKDSTQRAASISDRDWKLKISSIIIGEKEDHLPMRSPWRFASALELLRDGGITNRSAVHARLVKDADHARTIRSTLLGWHALHDFLWRGQWAH